MWEGIKDLSAPAEVHWQADADAAAREAAARRSPIKRAAPRVVVSGCYQASPTVMAAAAKDWAFSLGASPTIVVRDGDGHELVRASVDRLHAEYTAVVVGLSISYAPPPERPPPLPGAIQAISLGGDFSADLGFRLARPAAPRTLRVHAELGPLRSNEVLVRLLP